MDITTVRASQATLKERYRTDPQTARTPLSATADWRDPGVTTTVDCWVGPVRVGLHVATGGDGQDACSGDMLLQALLGCAGVTLRSVAAAMRLEIRAVQLRADGYFDARGTLGVDRSAPVGVRDVVVTATLDTNADDATLARLAELTERYCVVAQTMRDVPRFVTQRLN